MTTHSLVNKVAIITGAPRGIGRAIAILFAKAGARVVINYRTNKKDANKVLKLIRSKRGKAICVQADLSSLEGVNGLFSQVKKKWGRVDILVNNAGVLKSQGPFEMDWETTLETFVVNVITPMFCAREAMKSMIENGNGGCIINIASVRGLETCGLGGNPAYSAAKAGVINFTCSLAKEWDIKKNKIRVNAVAPGYTKTDMVVWDEATIEKRSKETALGKILNPDDIAQACLFLASDEASGITGEILVVDAGLRLK
jgi:3-oxoacyl-[acyl-carrier protein] reductase